MARRSSKSPEILNVNLWVEKFIPGGQTLGTLEDGKKIFLWNALPSEVVTKVQVTKFKSHFMEGIALEIRNPSPHRLAPRDDCYLATSPWQILDYDYELFEKELLVLEMFRQQGIILDSAQPIIAGEPYHYRNKMEYALYFNHEDVKIHLAFHARGSHRKAPIAQSNLERPEIFARAEEIVAQLNNEKADARQFQSLLLRCSQSGVVSGGLFENKKPRPQFPPLSDRLPVDDPVAETFTYSPNGFFQINLPLYSQVLRQVRSYIQTHSVAKVLDLYAGVGTIGLVAASGRDLTLVECDRSAYQEMLANVRQYPGENIHPILARSEEALEYIAPDQIVIVDPPRAGCRPEVLARFLEQRPLQIIYLSCNPITQARDVKILLEKYKITTFQPYNFFPRTPHIENLVILERKTHGS